MEHYSAGWYRSVLDGLHDMVLVKGAQSNLLWANQAFLKYYGMTQQELREIVDAPHSDPDDTLQYVRDDLTVIETGAPLNVLQEAVTDTAGNRRNFHTIKTPLRAGDEVIGLVAMSRLLEDSSIPGRGLDHQDAKAFVAPIRSIAESFPNPMLMVDIRQRVISASPLWKMYFGDPEIHPDSLFKDCFPGLSGLQANLGECLSGNQAVEGIVRQTGPDGGGRIFTVRTCPWEYRDGSMGGATIIATDVTALYEQSATLRKRNEELMQFSYRASHDLKGPLTTAKGLAQFITEDIAEGALDDARDNADKIIGLMEKLEHNISSFLALARSDVRGAPDEPIDLAQMITDICDGLAHQIQLSDVQISSDLKVTRLFGQKARFAQILENLVSNAVKYIDPAAPAKYVTVHSSVSPGGDIQLRVDDNGCGIPAGVGKGIFDKFARFHEDSEGTGLGLAIVKNHVDALRGRVWFETTGKGTCFYVTIPSQRMELAS